MRVTAARLMVLALAASTALTQVSIGFATHSATREREVSTLAGSGTVGFGAGGFADGSANSARFDEPRGLAVDAAGNIYVSDDNNHRIRRISPDGLVTTLAGSGEPGFADGLGHHARFRDPRGVAVDSNGAVYVADGDNRRVRKISVDGTVTTLAGSGGRGLVDGAGAVAQFEDLWDIAVDGEGTVYVADAGNHRIRKITSDGEVTTLAGSGGTRRGGGGFADGPAHTARFDTPQGVAVGADGAVYVSDRNNRIRRIGADGSVATLAGSGRLGIAAGGFADGPQDVARFNELRGLAVDADGNVYVADAGNYRVRMVAPNGDVTTIAGSGELGLLDGPGSTARFGFLFDVAIAAGGTIYVADTANHRIRAITSLRANDGGAGR